MLFANTVIHVLASSPSIWAKNVTLLAKFIVSFVALFKCKIDWHSEIFSYRGMDAS